MFVTRYVVEFYYFLSLLQVKASFNETKAPVKRIQHFTEQHSTFANLCSASFSAAQFGVVKRTKHFGKHLLSFVGAYAVLHKNWDKIMPCEVWAWAILMTFTAFLIAIIQGRAVLSSNEHGRARCNKWSKEYNISPSRNVERCSVKCCIRFNYLFSLARCCSVLLDAARCCSVKCCIRLTGA